MSRIRKDTSDSLHVSFSDMALLTLATFIFLLVIILIAERHTENKELPKIKAELELLKKKLNITETDNNRLLEDLKRVIVTDSEGQLETILATANIGRKDFDLFIEGLRDIPGKDLHMIVDASGSMHGVSTFLIPVLRMVVIRADKQLTAITWFSDSSAQTYIGTMAEMFDMLIAGAPFAGNLENIGRAFRAAIQNAPRPGAYMLIGDEPSDDTISYSSIPSPVFTLPMGRSDPGTEYEYLTLAQKTGGKMLHLDFR